MAKVINGHRVIGPGDDKEMIQSPNLWPTHPVLCLRRNNPAAPLGYDCGLIWDTDELRVKRIVVFLTIAFRLTADYSMRTVKFSELKDVQRLTYPSIDTCLADGWVVD